MKFVYSLGKLTPVIQGTRLTFRVKVWSARHEEPVPKPHVEKYDFVVTFKWKLRKHKWIFMWIHFFWFLVFTNDTLLSREGWMCVTVERRCSSPRPGLSQPSVWWPSPWVRTTGYTRVGCAGRRARVIMTRTERMKKCSRIQDFGDSAAWKVNALNSKIPMK